MAFDTLRGQYTKEHFWYCEVEVNSNTYRFCENRYTLPVGLSAIPTMTGQTMSPARIDLGGGLGVRATASVSMNEHQDYTIYGTASAPVRFWANWRAKNAGYQGGRLSIYSGYIENNIYSTDNFQRRDYVIESFSMTEKGVSLTAKDTLKLASNDRAKAPQKSAGKLSADIIDTTTSITLTPAGVGASGYPASGFGRMGDEVVSFTRSGDNFTIVRSQYTTLAIEHSQNDEFQLCLQYSDSLADIAYDLLTEYAGVPAAQIDKSQWDSESDLYFPGLYETLITEPIGVSDLLKELGESAPHYLFWDERVNKIIMTAVKPPPDSSDVYTPEANFLSGSVSVKDKTAMRVSTVIVNFGQKDPTEKLDEIRNYKQGYIRITPTSIAKYGGIQAYKVINSRWINNSNRAAAIRLAAKWGRRFQDTPREVSFSLDAKDGALWTGDPLFINSDLVLDETTGNRYDMPVQVISAGESKAYKYTAIEHGYGIELPEDLDSDDPNQRLVVLAGNIENINLRAEYDSVYPDVLDTYDIVFVFDSSCVTGSTSLTEAVNTGSFPGTLANPIKLDVRGLILGLGGTGASTGGSSTAGGLGLKLAANIRLVNSGIIGGGGAGGEDTSSVGVQAAGGGGAGYLNGVAGTGTNNNGSAGIVTQAQDGTNTSGGSGGFASSTDGFEPQEATGEDGGGLGDSTSGSAGGAAIDRDGFTITYITTGDIRGSIL